MRHIFADFVVFDMGVCFVVEDKNTSKTYKGVKPGEIGQLQKCTVVLDRIEWQLFILDGTQSHNIDLIICEESEIYILGSYISKMQTEIDSLRRKFHDLESTMLYMFIIMLSVQFWTFLF